MTKTRALTEYGPLLLFFACNLAFGIMPATGVLVVATVAAVAWSMLHERRVPWLAIVGAVMVSVFGGLTLALDDVFYLKIKPTVASLLFGAALSIGLLLRRNFLKLVFGSMIELDERGWRNLTVYWIGVFLVMAAANEVARHLLSTDGWATFKVFGLSAIAMVAAVGAAPLMRRARRDG